MYKIIDRQISKQFKGKGYFKREALRSFLTYLDPEISDSALTWRIHDLVTRKVIEQVKLGIYTVSNKELYKPTLSREFVRLSKIVVKEYSELEYCIWSTEWFNDFTRHQLGTFIFVIEVEKDFMEEVFNMYSEFQKYRVYFDPKKDIMERYVVSENSIVIKPLITRSPKQKITTDGKPFDEIYIPTLEKILIDVFSDTVLFYSIQGKEMDTLFENALKRYQVNFTKLISYARRRNKKDQITSYLKDNFGDLVHGILK